MSATYIEKFEYAVRHNLQNSVKQLLKCGANINHPYRYVQSVGGIGSSHQTVIFLAICLRTPSMLHLLIEHGANVNHTDANGDTPLFVAVLLKKKVYVEILLQAGAQVNKTNCKGHTPLHLSMNNGSLDILTLLLRYSFKPNQREFTNDDLYVHALILFNEAASQCVHTRSRQVHIRSDIVNVLGNHLPRPHSYIVWNAINICGLTHGNFDLAKVLICNGACVTDCDKCPLNFEKGLIHKTLDSVASRVRGPYILSFSFSFSVINLLYLAGSRVCYDIEESEITHYKGAAEQLEIMKTIPRTLFNCAVITIRTSITKCLTKSVSSLNLPPCIERALLMADITLSEAENVKVS